MATEPNPFSSESIAIFKPDYTYTQGEGSDVLNTLRYNTFISIIRDNLRIIDAPDENKSIDDTLALYLGIIKTSWPKTFNQNAEDESETDISNNNITYAIDGVNVLVGPPQWTATKNRVENAIKNAAYYKAAIALLKDVVPEPDTSGVREQGQYTEEQIKGVIDVEAYKNIINTPVPDAIVSPPSQIPMRPEAPPGLPASGAPPPIRVLESSNPPPGAPVGKRPAGEPVGQRLGEPVGQQAPGAEDEEGQQRSVSVEEDYDKTIKEFKSKWNKSLNKTSEVFENLLKQQFLFRVLHYQAQNQEGGKGRPYMIAFQNAVKALQESEKTLTGDLGVAVSLAKFKASLPNNADYKTMVEGLLKQIGLDTTLQMSGGAGSPYHWKYYDKLVAAFNSREGNVVKDMEDVGKAILNPPSTQSSAMVMDDTNQKLLDMLRSVIPALVARINQTLKPDVEGEETSIEPQVKTIIQLVTKRLQELLSGLPAATSGDTVVAAAATVETLYLKTLIEALEAIVTKIPDETMKPILRNILADLKKKHSKGLTKQEESKFLQILDDGILPILTLLLEKAENEATNAALERSKRLAIEKFNNASAARIAAVRAYKEAKERLAFLENQKNISFRSFSEYKISGIVDINRLRDLKREFDYVKVAIPESLEKLKTKKATALELLREANKANTKDLLEAEGRESGVLSGEYTELLAELNVAEAADAAVAEEELTRLSPEPLPTSEEAELDALLAAAPAEGESPPAEEAVAAEALAEEEAAAGPEEAPPAEEAPLRAAEEAAERPEEGEAPPAVPGDDTAAEEEAAALPEGEAPPAAAPAEGTGEAELPAEAPAPAAEPEASAAPAPAKKQTLPMTTEIGIGIGTEPTPEGFEVRTNEGLYGKTDLSSTGRISAEYLSALASEQTAQALGESKANAIQKSLQEFTDKIKAAVSNRPTRQFYNELAEILTAISGIESNILKRVIILQFIKANIQESLINGGEKSYESLSTDSGWIQFHKDLAGNIQKNPITLLNNIQIQIIKEIGKKSDARDFLNAFSIAIKYKNDNSKNLDAQIKEIFGINTSLYITMDQRLEWIDLFGSVDDRGVPLYVSKISPITLPTIRNTIKEAIGQYFQKKGYNLNSLQSLFGSSSVPSLPPVRAQTDRGTTPIGRGGINQGASTSGSSRPSTPLLNPKGIGYGPVGKSTYGAPGQMPTTPKFRGGGMDEGELEKFTQILLKGGSMPPPAALTPEQVKAITEKLKEQQKGIREVREILNNLREKYETYRKSVKDTKEFASEQILTEDEKKDFDTFIKNTSNVQQFKAVKDAIKERNEAKDAVDNITSLDKTKIADLMKAKDAGEVNTAANALKPIPTDQAADTKIEKLADAIKDEITKKSSFPEYQKYLDILKKLNKDIKKEDETFDDPQYDKATLKFEEIQKGNTYSEQEIIGISDYLKSNIENIKKSNTELSNKATAKIQEIVKSILETVKPFELREFFKLNNPLLLALMEGTEDDIVVKASEIILKTFDPRKEKDHNKIKGFIPLMNDIKRLFEKDANYYNNAFQQQAVGLEKIAKQKREQEETRLRAQAEGRARGVGVGQREGGGGAIMEGGEESADRKLLDEYLNTTKMSGVDYKNLSIFDYLEAISGILNSYVKRMINISDPAASAALSGDKSIFNLIFDKYTKTKETEPDRVKGEYEATNTLVSDLEINNLIPRDVLKVTMRDKVVFIFATLFLRLICMSIIEYLIEKGVLKNLLFSSAAYLGIFTVLFIGFVVLINLDMYRLRIVFNYVNFHGSSQNIYLYLILLWSFGMVVYFIMRSINRGVTVQTTNDESRSRLIYRMQVLSLIVWLFLVLMVTII